MVDCNLDYAKLKQAEKCKRYCLFMRQELTVTELKAYLCALLLLGIHSVRNHRKAWNTAKSPSFHLSAWSTYMPKIWADWNCSHKTGGGAMDKCVIPVCCHRYRLHVVSCRSLSLYILYGLYLVVGFKFFLLKLIFMLLGFVCVCGIIVLLIHFCCYAIILSLLFS